LVPRISSRKQTSEQEVRTMLENHTNINNNSRQSKIDVV